MSEFGSVMEHVSYTKYAKKKRDVLHLLREKETLEKNLLELERSMEDEQRKSTKNIREMRILLAKVDKSMNRKVGKTQGRNKIKSSEFDSYDHANVAAVTKFLYYKFMSHNTFLHASWKNHSHNARKFFEPNCTGSQLS